jgi:hypothetical protein
MTDSVKKSLQDSGYNEEYKPGKEAVKKEHRDKIRVRNSRCLAGSMDIDKACQKSEHDAYRWDYLAAIKKNHSENLALIEIHGAAKSSEVGIVIKKKEWLLQWLKKSKLAGFKKAFIWLSTGGTKITAQSKYARQLAHSGISFPRKVTPLLDTEVEYK